MIPRVAFYGLAGAWFLIMGIGSIQARRWARALILVSAWPWLCWGVLKVLFMIWTMVNSPVPMLANGRLDTFTIMRIVAFGFAVFFRVILPAALIIFYRRPDVKATCERWNPQPCWTERVPLPVLSLILIVAVAAPCALLMYLYGWRIPFFSF